MAAAEDLQPTDKPPFVHHALALPGALPAFLIAGQGHERHRRTYETKVTGGHCPTLARRGNPDITAANHRQSSMSSFQGLTTLQATQRLGITQASVRHLVALEHLAVSARTKRCILLDPVSVERLVNLGRRPGRAWSVNIAWAAIAWLC